MAAANNDFVSIPSVCLPRIFHKFDANYVEGIFCEIFGPDATGNSCIDHVDMVRRQDRNTGEPYHVVFLHFSEYMLESEEINDFVKRINSGEEVKIQYKPPWFWKVRKNNRQIQSARPRIMSNRDEQALKDAQKQVLQEQTAATTSVATNNTANNTETP